VVKGSANSAWRTPGATGSAQLRLSFDSDLTQAWLHSDARWTQIKRTAPTEFKSNAEIRWNYLQPEANKKPDARGAVCAI